MTTEFREEVTIDDLTVETAFAAPAGVLTDSEFSSSASDRLTAAKSEHKKKARYTTDEVSTTVASVSKSVFLFNAAGTIEAVKVRPDTAPTGGDLQYTVDVQKAASGSGSFSSILSSVVTVDSSSSDNTEQAGSVQTSDASAGDNLRVVVTTSGSTGTQGSGLTVEIDVAEDPS